MVSTLRTVLSHKIQLHAPLELKDLSFFRVNNTSTMKFAATTLIFVFAFFSNIAHAQVRGGQLNRSLQANGADLNCISVTSADGVKKTLTPCTTSAPVTTTTEDETDRARGGGGMTAGGGGMTTGGGGTTTGGGGMTTGGGMGGGMM
jgi:uncharacterized membrane protein YgcG